MSPHPTYRFLISLSLITVLALALTASGAPIAAQQAPISVQPSSAVTTDTFRSSPVMFIENAGQWDKRNQSQIIVENKADHTPVSPESWNVELVGQVGGGTYAIAVQGDYAYLGVGPRLVVLNIADPAHPTAISQTSVLPDKLADVVIAGSYAYVANLQGGLRVINVANAAAPVEVGHCDTPGSAHGVAIMGSYAYVADGSSGLRVIHIGDPTAPVEVGHHDTPGEALGVAVAGNYAYVADQQGGLRVINVANPAAPTEISFHRTFRAMAVAVSGGYAYVADEFNGLRVFRVTNPFAPAEVGKVTGVNAYDLVLGTGYAYVADEIRLVVVNIANPASPIVVGLWRAPTFGLDFELHVALAGDHALMARARSGLHLISVADPTRPTETSTYKSFLPHDNLAVANNRAFAVNRDRYPRFRMVDVSQPDKTTTVGVCCEDTINLDVAAAGNYAYIASDFDGLRVIDASNPASPAVIGWYGNFWAADVEVRGRYAYVWGDGLRVFDVSAPSTPILMGVLKGIGVWGVGIYFGHVAMTDNHAYAVPGFEDELEVYAITNPRAPSLIAQVRLPYRPEQVAISGNHLFIAAGTSGLRTMDVSNPRSPVEVASWQVPGGAKGVAASGSHLYIGTGANGLRVMDISNPLEPIEVGYYEAFPERMGKLVLSEGLIYVYREDLTPNYYGGGGLYVLRFRAEPPTYTITGRVTDANGAGIPGVTVWADATHNTTTDANGNYTLTGLPGGTYNIRPEKAPYAFSPPSRTVTVPPNATGVNFQAVAITKIQVNQVLGNTTNYVAGKDTAVRVFLSGAVPFDPDHQQLQIYRNGNLITQTPVKPQKFSGRSDVLDFLCDRQECDEWKKGFYTFEARVNGDYLSQPSVEFKERRKLRILVRPVTVVDATGIHTPDPDLSSYADFLKRVYPLAADAVDWQIGIPYVYNALLFPPLNGDMGRKLLWHNLTLSYWLPGYHDVVLGVLPPTDLGGLAGYTLGPPTSIVMEGDSLQADIAHEIGHNIGVRNPLFPGRHEGLGDEYNSPCAAFQCDNNPPPKVYRGLDGRTFGGCGSPANFSCLASQAELWKPGSGCGSKVIGAMDYPFDVVTGQALDDRLSFMGCSTGNQTDYWITPAAYNYLFDNLAPGLLSASATLATERVARVTGWIGQDGSASLDPVYHLLAERPSTGSGSYSIQVLDSSGQIMARQAFDVSFLALTNPPQTLTQAPFRLTVVLPNGANRVQVLLGTMVLTERTVSAHAPTLALTAPTAGQTWAATGNYTIRWQGSDLDDDTLYYTVLYRQGTGDWIVLGADLTTNELTVDAAGLPGGTAAQVQVLATDGINTTTAESGLFTVGRKGPEAFITYPAEGASFMPGVSFFLQGTAYDLEDGTLPDSAYHWTSDRDGDLGTGATNLVILSPGPHVITLTVRDSDGNTTVKTLRISAGSQQFMPLIYRSQ